MVHNWRVDDRKAALPKPADVPVLPLLDFIALDAQPEAEMPVREIRVELRRGTATAVAHWLMESADWLCEWLR